MAAHAILNQKEETELMRTKCKPMNKWGMIWMGLGIMVAIIVPQQKTVAAAVDLGWASGFAVLAGSGITISTPSTITGDIGSYATATIAGVEKITFTGVNHVGDATTQSAKNDLLVAYNDAAGRAAGATYADLVGLILAPGVYSSASSLAVSGTVTLDAAGDPDAVWIFQAGSTLITASDSIVALIGGAQAGNVFWQVGSSATLGTGTDFAGSILAFTSITLNTGAVVDGRVLALNGAVTLDDNIIIVPVAERSTLYLLGAGMATILCVKRKAVNQGGVKKCN